MEILKVKTKGNIVMRDIFLSVITGIYFLLVLTFHATVINFFLNKVGVRFYNPYGGLTIFILYLITPVSAGFLTYKINKPVPFSFDKTLINGLVSALVFALPILFLAYLRGKSISVIAFIGILFFSTLFSFIIAALSTTLLSKIFTKQE